MCGRVRLIRVLGVLILYGKSLGKDYDQCNREDVERLVSHLLHAQPRYSPETLGTYKAILKNFLTWVVQPNDFPTKHPPAIVAWITTHVRARDKRKLERNDLLTPTDIERLLHDCHNPRDKALISMLWETGARIAEIGNLQCKHVTKAQHGFLLHLHGKTGTRTPLVVASGPYLAQWLANHPFASQPESPLWVHYHYARTPKLLRYDTIRYLLNEHCRRAGIAKHLHPHIFRHSRATHCLAHGIMNEQAAKTYFGWAPDSHMLATYSHLVDQDANNAILRENRLTPATSAPPELLVRSCRYCDHPNTPTTLYCARCTNPLDERAAHHGQDSQHALVLRLAQVLVEQGLLPQAATAVHDAGLGETLKRLATTTPVGNATADLR